MEVGYEINASGIQEHREIRIPEYFTVQDEYLHELVQSLPRLL